MSIIVRNADITKINCDAIVNPANSFGYMGGGVAGAIKREGGVEIENEAIKKAPISIGEAIATTSGNLSCKYIIHTPTMIQPAMKTNTDNIEKATYAALKLAKKLDINIIVIPGMGTGVGRVPKKDAARSIIKIVKEFENKFEKIILVDHNKKMIEFFKAYI